MPRVSRTKIYRGVYHIILRGVNKQTIFEDDEDKQKFLETLLKFKPISGYELYGYCLMDNHVHLLIHELVESLAVAFKRICSSYVFWYNQKYERCGHLFQERFKSEVVETRLSFLKVLRYIHQNPLKAGLTDNVFDSKWTSISEYTNRAHIVNTEYGLQLISPDLKKAIEWYRNYMQQPNNDLCMDQIVRVRMRDCQVLECLNQLGISSISELQQLSIGERNEKLLLLKNLDGISIRQLARITGISKSVIQRVGQGDRSLVPGNNW
jgi:putative transposase